MLKRIVLLLIAAGLVALGQETQSGDYKRIDMSFASNKAWVEKIAQDALDIIESKNSNARVSSVGLAASDILLAERATNKLGYNYRIILDVGQSGCDDTTREDDGDVPLANDNQLSACPTTECVIESFVPFNALMNTATKLAIDFKCKENKSHQASQSSANSRDLDLKGNRRVREYIENLAYMIVERINMVKRINGKRSDKLNWELISVEGASKEAVDEGNVLKIYAILHKQRSCLTDKCRRYGCTLKVLEHPATDVSDIPTYEYLGSPCQTIN